MHVLIQKSSTDKQEVIYRIIKPTLYAGYVVWFRTITTGGRVGRGDLPSESKQRGWAVPKVCMKFLKITEGGTRALREPPPPPK